MFADGHSEAVLRRLIVDPTNDQWRARWNNDNQAHSTRTGELPIIPDSQWERGDERRLDP
jgi:hypothetical protein